MDRLIDLHGRRLFLRDSKDQFQRIDPSELDDRIAGRYVLTHLSRLNAHEPRERCPNLRLEQSGTGLLEQAFPGRHLGRCVVESLLGRDPVRHQGPCPIECYSRVTLAPLSDLKRRSCFLLVEPGDQVATLDLATRGRIEADDDARDISRYESRFRRAQRADGRNLDWERAQNRRRDHCRNRRPSLRLSGDTGRRSSPSLRANRR